MRDGVCESLFRFWPRLLRVLPTLVLWHLSLHVFRMRTSRFSTQFDNGRCERAIGKLQLLIRFAAEARRRAHTLFQMPLHIGDRIFRMRCCSFGEALTQIR